MPTTADTALRTSIKRVRRPDVMIGCTPPSSASYEALTPLAAFEVLSPSTRCTDKLTKLGEYMRHPTLRHVVFIDPAPYDVLVYSREIGGEWASVSFDRPTGIFTLDGSGASLSLAQIYRGLETQPRPGA
jgi:Uma2 family endonuclease